MKVFRDIGNDVVLIDATPQADRIGASILWFDQGIVGTTRTLKCGNESVTVELPKAAIGQSSTKLFVNKHLYYA